MHRFLKYTFILSAVLIITGICSEPACLSASTEDEIQTLIDQEYPSLEKLYRHLHSHPELSFSEQKTSARLAHELKNIGFEVTSHVGGYGIVGVLKNGQGPTVLVRTDMDALPIKEQTGLLYASHVSVTDEGGNEVGVMHACGHDAHMTVFVGTARLAVQLKDQWQGTLVMIGQPAEEKGAGAKAMLADGLFENFPRPDYCLALHVHPEIPIGKVGYHEGYAMANVDTVDIIIHGVGGHGAAPHQTKDPVVIAAEVILALQTIVSREINPIEPAVITVGSIHSGTKHNIISDQAHLQLTVRSYSPEVRHRLLTAIERVTKGIVQSAGVPEDRMPEIKVKESYTPSLYNDPPLTRRLTKVFQTVLGPENVVSIEPEMIGEDFARYGRAEPAIPICMFRLGTVSRERIEESLRQNKPLPPLHSADFAPVPKPTIKTGVKTMTAVVLELMR